MASVGDYIFLAIVLAIIGGIVYAVKSSSVNDSLAKQKESMKGKGIHLTSDGLSVKTNRVQLSREEEVNKAQASWAKSGEMMKKHKDAFKFNPAQQPGAAASTAGAQTKSQSTKKHK